MFILFKFCIWQTNNTKSIVTKPSQSMWLSAVQKKGWRLCRKNFKTLRDWLCQKGTHAFVPDALNKINYDKPGESCYYLAASDMSLSLQVLISKVSTTIRDIKKKSCVEFPADKAYALCFYRTHAQWRVNAFFWHEW